MFGATSLNYFDWNNNKSDKTSAFDWTVGPCPSANGGPPERLEFFKPRKLQLPVEEDLLKKSDDEGAGAAGAGGGNDNNNKSLFVDGGRRLANNPWNLKKPRIPILVSYDKPLSRPVDDPLNDLDPSVKTLMVSLEEKAQKTRTVLKALSDATGMPIVQENGQRRFGPPLDAIAPPPRGSEVFVGKIPRDAMEPELVPVFAKAGNIYELRLMMDFSGSNRGYCFVQYHTPEEADRAVRLLNHYEIRRGRAIGVSKSVDNCRLFLGGVPVDKTEEEITEEIKSITEGVVRVIVYPNSKNPSHHNRGYAFVEYESHKAAAMARRKMIPGNIQLFGCDVAVDWAEPEAEKKRNRNKNAYQPKQSNHAIRNNPAPFRSVPNNKFKGQAPSMPISSPFFNNFNLVPPAAYNLHQFGPRMNYQHGPVEFHFRQHGLGMMFPAQPQPANYNFNQPSPSISMNYAQLQTFSTKSNDRAPVAPIGPRMSYTRIFDYMAS